MVFEFDCVDSPVNIRMGPCRSDSTPLDICRLIIVSCADLCVTCIGLGSSVLSVLGNNWTLGVTMLTDRLKIELEKIDLFGSCVLLEDFGADVVTNDCICFPAEAMYWLRYFRCGGGALG